MNECDICGGQCRGGHLGQEVLPVDEAPEKETDCRTCSARACPDRKQTQFARLQTVEVEVLS